MTKVHYREAVLKQNPGLDEPQLEMVRLDGRIAVVYSRYGLGCPIDGHPCGGCKAYQSESALNIFANVVMNALAGTAEFGSANAPPQKKEEEVNAPK